MENVLISESKNTKDDTIVSQNNSNLPLSTHEDININQINNKNDLTEKDANKEMKKNISIHIIDEIIPKSDKNYILPKKPENNDNIVKNIIWLSNILYNATEPNGGGHLTKKLYVPSKIWEIEKPRILMIYTKILILEAMISYLESLERQNVDVKTKIDYDIISNTIQEFYEHLTSYRKNLRMDNSHISPPSTPNNINESLSIGKQITNAASIFGRIVRKQAVAAVEKVNSTILTEVPTKEFQRYKLLIRQMCSKTQILEIYNNTSEINQKSKDQLNETFQFFRSFFTDFIIKDIQLLLQHYLLKSCEQFGQNVSKGNASLP